MKFDTQRNFFTTMQRKDFLDRLWPYVLKGEGSRDTSGPGRSDTLAFSKTREGGWPVDVARHALYTGPTCTREAARRITSCRFVESTPGSTGVDLKLAAPAWHPRLALTWPRHGHTLGYFESERDRELWRKRGEKKRNNNNRSLPGTSWSRARSSSWDSSTCLAIGTLLQEQSAKVYINEIERKTYITKS